MNKKEFFEIVKDWMITKELGKCEETTVKILEERLLKALKKEMIEKIEAIENVEDMKLFTLNCAHALLKDYENIIKDMKENKNGDKTKNI